MTAYIIPLSVIYFFAGADFNSLTRTLIFASNVTEFSVSVEINEDLIAEGTEQFSVILSRNSEPAAMIIQNTSTVFITDDDGRPFIYSTI